jgi:hypothetical protein
VTDVINDEKAAVDLDAGRPQPSGVAGDELVRQLAERARAEGLRLTGEGGLLSQLTKVVVESALDGELDDHLGYSKHDPAGRDGGNSRNGKRGKTVLTEAGPVSIEVPRDREGSFDPQLVKKRRRRLTGLDDLVISLSAKGSTHGEICAHLAEVYGASVLEADHLHDHRPGDRGHGRMAIPPTGFGVPSDLHPRREREDRDGNVANRPIYIALAVTVEGTCDILGLWAGEHGDGEGAKFWVRVLSEIKNRGVGDVCMVVCDGLKGLPASIETVWPQAITQTCVVHLLRNSFRYASKKALGRPGQGSQTDLHRAERIGRPGCVRRRDRGVGRSVPGDHQTVGVRVAGICSVPAVRHHIRAVICTTPSNPSIRGSAEQSTPAATFPPRPPR